MSNLFLQDLISIVSTYSVAFIVLTIVYTFYLTISRLYFSPISHIPGPRLAAATWWYDFYYQIIKGGQFYKQVTKLHKQYGPIVRISPTEVHFDDPQFYDAVYANSERRDKVHWHKNTLTATLSAFATIEHDLHRLRRTTLNPYFSKAQIRKFAPWIQERVDTLCRRFEQEYKNKDKVLIINEAYACLTADAVFEYSFAENYNLVAKPDFHAPLTKNLELFLRSFHIVNGIPGLVYFIFEVLPSKFVIWLDPLSEVVFRMRDDLERQIDSIMTGNKDKYQDVEHATIFSEILQSKRPEQEKTKKRLHDEAQIVISAGIETTAWTMSVITFYLLHNPEVLRTLRKELEDAWTHVSVSPDLTTLEALPYLSAVIQEGLRLAYGVAARLPRIAPDKDITYTTPSGDISYIIPRGTPISMTSIMMHHNESVFPHSHTFAPERWLASPPDHLRAPILQNQNANSNANLSRYLVSFSKGSRNCLGMQLAYAELYITIANVVRRNEFVLFETGLGDVVIDREFLLARPREGSKGIRVLVV